jgi:hypothetical protein
VISMEALAALSLAGNIIQFVDFSSKILSATYELYTSTTRSLTVNDELELVTLDLKALLGRLRQNPKGQQRSNDGFTRLCEEAAKVAQLLLDRLESLKVQCKHQKWRSLEKALKNAWSKQEIDGLRSRLSQLQQALDTHVLVSLRNVLQKIILRNTLV